MGKEKKVSSNETINPKISEESELQIRSSSNNENETRRFAKISYENFKKIPDIWRSSACAFKTVADSVLIEVDKDEDGRPNQKSPVSDVYVFLMSVAIENILKGILVASGKRVYEELISGKLGHNISNLYKDCCELFELPVTKDDEWLLSILTTAASWVGRYNLPTSPEKFEEALVNHGLNIAYTTQGLSISLLLSKHAEAEPGERKATRGKINALYERLYAKFEEVMAAGQ